MGTVFERPGRGPPHSPRREHAFCWCSSLPGVPSTLSPALFLGPGPAVGRPLRREGCSLVAPGPQFPISGLEVNDTAASLPVLTAYPRPQEHLPMPAVPPVGCFYGDVISAFREIPGCLWRNADQDDRMKAPTWV